MILEMFVKWNLLKAEVLNSAMKWPIFIWGSEPYGTLNGTEALKGLELPVFLRN